MGYDHVVEVDHPTRFSFFFLYDLTLSLASQATVTPLLAISYCLPHRSTLSIPFLSNKAFSLFLSPRIYFSFSLSLSLSPQEMTFNELDYQGITIEHASG